MKTVKTAAKKPTAKKEPTIADKIEALKEQQEQAKEMFLKCQGAIEVLEGLK